MSSKSNSKINILNSIINILKKMISQREFLLIVIIFAMCLIIGNYNEGFWTVATFLGLARSFALDAIVLVGMTYLLIAGKFDISVASVMALTGYIFGQLFLTGIPIIFSALATLALAGVIGVVNGLIITKLNVNPFITTLGMQTIVRGLVQAISQGRPIRVTDRAFTILTRHEIFGIPTFFIIVVVLLILVDISLRKVRYFRQFYFIGGNETSAQLIGINVDKVRIILYVVCAMLAAVSGMLSASRLAGASPLAYAGRELTLLAAAVIGGCSLSGGKGTMFGSALGLLFLFILNNGLIMFRVDIFWFNFAVGVFLLLVVLINTLSEEAIVKRQKRSMSNTPNTPKAQSASR